MILQRKGLRAYAREKHNFNFRLMAWLIWAESQRRHWKGARTVSASHPGVCRCGRTDYCRSKPRHPSDCHYAILERLAQDLEHMTAKLGQLIQEEDAVVGQRHFAWHRHVAPADQPDI
jgi:hypothetical protein